jgi:predicted O-linked N-acetylglucosamine transferase (SPINDLY family)
VSTSKAHLNKNWHFAYNEGRSAFGRGALAEAAGAFSRAIEINPNAAEVYHDLAVVRHAQRRYDEALDAFKSALVLNNSMAQAWFNGANSLRELDRLDEAAMWLHQAVILKPDFLDAHYNLANTFKFMGQHKEAREHYRAALQIDPHMAEAHNNLGTLSLGNGLLEKALCCFKQAMQCQKNYGQAMYNYGLTLNRLGRAGEAVDYARSCIELESENGDALALLVSLLQQTCDWHQLRKAEKQLDRLTRQQLANDLRTSESPFLNFARCTNARYNFRISSSWSRHLASSHPLHHPRFAFTGDLDAHRQLNVGYLSERFRNAATGHLSAGIFGRHNRERFNVFAYSWGEDDGSYYRRKIESGVDHFIDIRGMSDFDAAARINDDGIDILVDMMGWMHGHRMAILAQRPAPIQVNYLGYPGTSGADFMDYLLADQVVIPPEQRQYYSEQVIWMPHCYQANDPQTPIDTRVHTRREYGLPENGIVFCSFNNGYKIDPVAFEAWMRILHRVPNSVLWLLVRSSGARRNLSRAAEAQGIDCRRLIFASPLAKAVHMARLKLSNLALDTLTVNGHTTTSDALMAGIPVITCLGSHFASRVAASILHAVGLDQLVTRSVSDYEDLAVSLALNRSQRREMINRLAHNKHSHPLFDIDRYVRNLEAGFRQMWQQYVKGSNLVEEKSA